MQAEIVDSRGSPNLVNRVDPRSYWQVRRTIGQAGVVRRQDMNSSVTEWYSHPPHPPHPNLAGLTLTVQVTRAESINTHTHTHKARGSDAITQCTNRDHHTISRE